ncbi:MAG TPA: hypothetical protein VGL99_11425 [Chloroflexota bacterium]|jgi:hypothetical protein
MQVDDGEGRKNGQDAGGRPERIGIGGGDDAVTRIQLAARWAESFAPERGDTLVASLKRFRLAYDYLDSVLHGVEPTEPEPDQSERRSPAAAAAPPSSYTPPSAEPPTAPPPPSSPESESRPWG